MPEMTKTKARQWLKAVDSMIAYYKGENDKYSESAYCIFCDIEERCYNCLWFLFDKIGCEDYARHEFQKNIYPLKVRREPTWVIDSLKRLARWRKRLVGIVGEDKEND